MKKEYDIESLNPRKNQYYKSISHGRAAEPEDSYFDITMEKLDAELKTFEQLKTKNEYKMPAKHTEMLKKP